MAKKRKSNFRDKVGADSERQKREVASYGHLLLPKGVTMFSPEPGGRASLDFLPYRVTDPNHPDKIESAEVAVKDSLWWKRPYKTHRNIGAGNDTCVCLKSIKKKCPVCMARAELMKKGADKEETDALKSSDRVLYAVVPLNNKKFEEVPHIWDMSWWLFEKLLQQELEEEPDNRIFPDLDEGLTLKIRFESREIAKSKPFADASRIDFIEREEAYSEDILEDVPDLDKVLKILSYKELEDLYLEVDEEEEDGGGLDEDEDDEEDEAPKRSRKSLKKKPAKVEEDDEDEEDEDDEEEEEEDDEDEEPIRKPKKKTSTRRR